MPHKHIIHGLGWAGSTLLRCLRADAMDVVARDMRSSNPDVTISKRTVDSLCSILSQGHDDFRERTAAKICDYSSSRGGLVQPHHPDDSLTVDSHRACALVAGLDHFELDDIPPAFAPVAPEDTLHVAADGSNSPARAAACPRLRQTVLPFVVYYGRSAMSTPDFVKTMLPLFRTTKTLHHLAGDIRFTLSYSTSPQRVNVSWTYSRPARPGYDPLYRPERLPKEASVIPPEFYQELAANQPPADIFGGFLDPEKVRHHRVLNWLMRSLSLTDADLDACAAQGLVLVGDSAHPMPILGSRGADLAVQDALVLAELLRDGNPEDSARDVARAFYQRRGTLWREQVRAAEQRLVEMHRTRVEPDGRPVAQSKV